MIRQLYKIAEMLAGFVLSNLMAAVGVVEAIFRKSGENSERPRQNTALRAILGFGIIGAVLGGLVFVSGIVPIKASSRHWPITEWFLHTGMERSVSTHSLGIEVPPLDDPNLVLKGAGHYEIGCRSCHGSPGAPLPLIMHMMTPSPPELRSRIGKWKDAELFHIVKHGVKFTGMPAWPAPERDDEVWAMVAFLRTLPKLNAADYRHLAGGEPPKAVPPDAMEAASEDLRATIQSCARCHGQDGIGRGSGAFPNLAGQRRDYLKNALTAYAGGNRHSGTMQPVATALTPETIEQLSDYYSRLARGHPATPAEANIAAIERGRAIAGHGVPSQRLPSCIDCHAPEGNRFNPAFPDLSGQPSDYLILQLELFRDGRRGGSSYAHLMDAVAPRLKPEQIRDVALYFESLRP